MAAPAYQGWQQQLLRQIGAPATPQNLSFLDAWLHAEGGTASNNPFNTTQSAPGASNYNSVGVKNYGSPQAGLAATVATLQNGRYQPILDSLRRGNNAQQTANALVASPWGTKHIYLNGSPVSPQSPQLPAAPAAVAPIPQPASGVGASSSTLPLLQLISANQQAAGLPGLSPLLLAAASRQSTPQPAPAAAAPATSAAPSVHVEGNVTGRVKGAVDLVQKYLGTPYVWGGEKPGGFDCSGLLQYVWGQVGVNIPRTTYDQFQSGKAVAKSQLQPGDAVFFTGSDPKGGLPGHVGMYLGGGKMIEAPHAGAQVRISDLAGRSDFAGGRRYA